MTERQIDKFFAVVLMVTGSVLTVYGVFMLVIFAHVVVNACHKIGCF